MRGILPKELSIGSTIYSCIFFNEINRDRSFHVSEEGFPVAKRLTSWTVISEFELRSYYCVHFWTNTVGKGMNTIIMPTMVK